MDLGGGVSSSAKDDGRADGFRPARDWRRFRLICLAAAGVMLLPAATGGVHGDVPEKVYTYSVTHPTHGDIGIYRNNIRDDGVKISVRNQIDVTVKILLVEAHKETSRSEELWEAGRLVSFSGVTKENGKETVVTGEAEGAKFIVETPEGSKEAPAGVYPNNPWSKSILKASVLLGTKSGDLYKVHAEPGKAKTIDLNGRSVATDYYRVDGDAKYELWFDERGVAVKFSEIGEHGTITFDLKDEKILPASAVSPTKDTKG